VQIIIPYVLSRPPHPQWKNKFVRTFIWAAHAQEIGLWCTGVGERHLALLAEISRRWFRRG
jgi:hypothetical protein